MEVITIIKEPRPHTAVSTSINCHKLDVIIGFLIAVQNIMTVFEGQKENIHFTTDIAIKVEFMADVMYWIALDKGFSECVIF